MSSVQFGYYPEPLEWTRGDITVASLPQLKQTVGEVNESTGIEREWIYPGLVRTRDFMSGGVRVGPRPGRIFGLPRTHKIDHAHGTRERLEFLVWCLGFIVGMRLTTTEAGFLDATPITPGKLHDIHWCGRECNAKALEHVDEFWAKHAARPETWKAITGVIHSYFLAQRPTLLAFERFIYLYVALDGCHYIYRKTRPHRAGSKKQQTPVAHSDRVAELCRAFNMNIPAWAAPSTSAIARVRNETLHEGLFFGEPLGFAVLGGSRVPSVDGSVPLQMQALVSRLLVALLGIPARDYIESRIDSRQYCAATL